MALSAEQKAERIVQQTLRGFITAEQGLKKIFESELWVDLGYSNFAQLWIARFKDNLPELNKVMKAEVLYRLFAATPDASDKEIVEQTGISDQTVRNARRGFELNIPPEDVPYLQGRRRNLGDPPPEEKAIIVNVPIELYDIIRDGGTSTDVNAYARNLVYRDAKRKGWWTSLRWW